MVRKKTTKVQDASSMIGEELALEMDDDERKRREKGELEDGMVIKANGLSYGGATSLAEAKTYLKNVERVAEFGEGVGLFSACLENILNSNLDVDEMTKKINNLLDEATRLIFKEKGIVAKSQQGGKSKMGLVSTRGAISLQGALRNLVESAAGKNYQVNLGVVVREVEKAIANLPPGQREKAKAQLKADLQPYIETENVVKKGSIRWCAMINSGLSPETGRPLEEHKLSLEEIVEQGTASVAKAIERSAARQAKARGEPVKEVSSIRRAARKASGLGDGGEILF